MKHAWRIKSQSFAVQLHECKTCGVKRLRIHSKVTFPTLKYTARDGSVTKTSPQCAAESK